MKWNFSFLLIILHVLMGFDPNWKVCKKYKVDFYIYMCDNLLKRLRGETFSVFLYSYRNTSGSL